MDFVLSNCAQCRAAEKGQPEKEEEQVTKYEGELPTFYYLSNMHINLQSRVFFEPSFFGLFYSYKARFQNSRFLAFVNLQPIICFCFRGSFYWPCTNQPFLCESAPRLH